LKRQDCLKVNFKAKFIYNIECSIPPSALPSPFAPLLDRFGRFLTLGRSALAVGGVDDAELETGSAAVAVGAGEQ